MNDKTEGQMSTEDKTSEAKEIKFGDTAYKLWNDTIEHVAAELGLCLNLLQDEDNRQYPSTVSDTLDILRSCLKALELLQQLEKDASLLRENLPK